MPEGHTLHRLARDLGRDLVGHTLAVSSPQGRFAEAEGLSGTELVQVSARGKHLFLRFSGAVVHVHLGLFGRFRRHKGPPPEGPASTVRLRLSTGELTWDLRGSTACALVDHEAEEALLARIGADPLVEGDDPEPAFRAMRRSSRAIGALLLDQSLVSGIGNVYRAELLFLVGVHPETPGRDVSLEALRRLWKLAVELLAVGVAKNRIVTRTPPKGVRATRRETLYVYKRRVCTRCESSIEKPTVGGRPAYVCPVCQPKLEA